MITNHDDLFGQITYLYTRAQAIEDGELVDVSKMAKQAGFKISVAVTHAVWDQYIEWTEEDTKKQTMQDQSSRLWDVLWMLYAACKRSKGESCIQYELYVIPRDTHSNSPIRIRLKSSIGGGDEGEPVITIMLPNED